MGLDNYAARHPKGGLTEEDEQALRDAGIDLCGGLEIDGTVSFHGKVHDTLIRYVTGISLYRDSIPLELVARWLRY